MPVPVQALPTVGLPNSTEDAKTRSCISELQSLFSAHGYLTFPIADGDRVLRVGVQNVSGIDSADAAAGIDTGTIAHGLASAPTVVLMLAESIATYAGGANQPIAIALKAGSITSSHFDWCAKTLNGRGSNNGWNIYWAAII